MQRSASESGFHFLQDYLKCQQYFKWKYPEGLEPSTKAPALSFGTAIHEALAAWYEAHRTGLDFTAKLSAALSMFRESMEAEKDSYQDFDKYTDDLMRGQILLQAYSVEYPREPWQVLAIEEAVEYTFPDTGDTFTGRVDLVVRNEGRDYIVDHKTTGWNLSSLGRSLQVSDQATGYIWLWNIAHPDRPVTGIIFNILRQYKNSNDFQPILVVKTDEDITRFSKESRYVLNEIATKVSDPNAIWPRNTGACFLYNRPCAYLELCFGSNFAEGLIGTMFKKRINEPAAPSLDE